MMISLIIIVLLILSTIFFYFKHKNLAKESKSDLAFLHDHVASLKTTNHELVLAYEDLELKYEQLQSMQRLIADSKKTSEEEIRAKVDNAIKSGFESLFDGNVDKPDS
jgi:ABC-type transport system involved in cytochrome bd biosynthesis fused ATPase/permease subunit